jgi:uncharacterized protein YkwD
MAVNISYHILNFFRNIISFNLKYLTKFVNCLKFYLQKDASETKNVIADALDRHNFYRKKHNVPPLKINSKVCNYK